MVCAVSGHTSESILQGLLLINIVQHAKDVTMEW